MPSRRAELSIEDWLWHRLCMVATQMREANAGGHDAQAAAAALQPLANLQSLLYERLGEGHFNRDRQSPLLFFSVLLHSLQFERALAFLRTYAEHADESLHLALALHHAGLLHTASSDASDGTLLVGAANGQPPRLCLAEMLKMHVAAWAREDGATALQYIFLLRGAPAETEALAVETLLAANQTDVLLTRLAFLPWPTQTRLMGGAARRLHVERGLSSAAARLLFESQAYSPLCELLLEMLSAAILDSSAANPARALTGYGSSFGSAGSAAEGDDPAAEARAKSLRDDASVFLEEWRRADADAAASQGGSLEMLLAVADLLYTAAEWRRQRAAPTGGEQALTAVLARLAALPLLPAMPTQVDAAQQNFRSVPTQVQRLAPALILTAMEATHAKFVALRRNGGAGRRPAGGGGGNSLVMGADAELRTLRERGEALMSFGGLSAWRAGDAMGLAQLPAAASQQLAAWLSEMA